MILIESIFIESINQSIIQPLQLSRMSTSDLFANPPQGVMDVFSTVFSIATEQWKTLGLIAIFQLLSLAAAVTVLALVTSLAAAGYIMSMMKAINHLTGNGGGAGRSLVDYSAGFHGASRLLDGNYDFDDMDDDLSNLFTSETIAVLAVVFILWAVTLSLVTSLYTGTFYHALGNIYTGGFPSVKESMSRGMSQMWSLYLYTLMVSLIIVALFLLMVLLPLKSLNFGVIFLGLLMFIVSVVLLVSLMAGAAPSIIVERRSATQAFGRSLDLCRSFIGFIFCTQFCYGLAIIVLSVVLNIFFTHLPGVLAFLGHLIVNILSTAIVPV